MSDEPIPLWKRALERARGPAALAKAKETRLSWKTVDAALLDALGGDQLGAQAFFNEFRRGSAEDRRALLQFLGRRMPQQVEQTVDHQLTVKIVTQLGNQEIVIDGGHTANLRLPPKDVKTGQRLEVVDADA